ncbi:MAG: diaminopimelate epimerase [Syntrophomonadaceae bacterium]|jgi:diaminopimelate epimerase|nr:diaminopimelate epimerase [Syntrophomonadaceae bacterium]
MDFVKMHGTGNDFIIINVAGWEDFDEYQPWAAALCDRNYGVGADGLIGVGRDEKSDVFMRIFNSDGSEAEMCGNGIRCVAHYARREKISGLNHLSVRTLAGTRHLEILSFERYVSRVKVDMGEPVFSRELIPVSGTGSNVGIEVAALGKKYIATAVSMGNPHCVIFVDNAEEVPLEEVGPVLEKNELFPAKANVEFVQIVDAENLIMRVWERGAGITNACGTGACAALAAAVLNNYSSERARIRLPGGVLLVEWEKNSDNRIYMTGPAQEVFTGSIDLDKFFSK